MPVPSDRLSIPEYNADRVTRLEVGHARHDEQIKDHDRVLRALEKHLSDLVDQFADLKMKALLVAVLYFAGSGKAENVLHLFGL